MILETASEAELDMMSAYVRANEYWYLDLQKCVQDTTASNSVNFSCAVRESPMPSPMVPTDTVEKAVRLQQFYESEKPSQKSRFRAPRNFVPFY